jgi:hypothetical protein
MAIITKLTKSILENPQKNKETEAVYYIIDLEERYLQIDTFGSKGRKYPNKASQSIRLNRDMAHQLKYIIEETFK